MCLFFLVLIKFILVSEIRHVYISNVWTRKVVSIYNTNLSVVVCVTVRCLDYLVLWHYVILDRKMDYNSPFQLRTWDILWFQRFFPWCYFTSSILRCNILGFGRKALLLYGILCDLCGKCGECVQLDSYCKCHDQSFFGLVMHVRVASQLWS